MCIYSCLLFKTEARLSHWLGKDFPIQRSLDVLVKLDKCFNKLVVAYTIAGKKLFKLFQEIVGKESKIIRSTIGCELLLIDIKTQNNA